MAHESCTSRWRGKQLRVCVGKRVGAEPAGRDGEPKTSTRSHGARVNTGMPNHTRRYG